MFETRLKCGYTVKIEYTENGRIFAAVVGHSIFLCAESIDEVEEIVEKAVTSFYDEQYKTGITAGIFTLCKEDDEIPDWGLQLIIDVLKLDITVEEFKARKS